MMIVLIYVIFKPLSHTSLFHLQVGNVYVQFREEEHAANALRNLTGRFYAGCVCLLRCSIVC